MTNGEAVTPERIVGRAIASARERRGLTQQELGDELVPFLGRAWPKQVVSSVENGRRQLTPTEILAVASVLGIPVATMWSAVSPGESVSLPGGMRLPYDVYVRALLGDLADATEAVDAAGSNLIYETVARQLRQDLTDFAYQLSVLFSLAARVLVITDDADREVLEKLIRDLRRFRHPSRVGSVFNDTMFSMFNEEDEDSEGGD